MENTPDFETFLAEKQALPTTTATGKPSEVALGAKLFYDAVAHVLHGGASHQEVGLIDAVNDTLQAIGGDKLKDLSAKNTFLKLAR